MRLGIRPAIFLLLIIVFFSSKAWPQQSPTKSQELAKWIMSIVIERAQENEKIKRSYTAYDKKVVKTNLQKNPPQTIETSVYQVYGEGGKSLEKLKERDRRPIRNARPEISMLDFNAILIERYNFNLEREELIEGRGYYVINFKPKEPIDKLPFEDRFDEGINRTTGHLYVDMEKFYLKSMEGRLISTFVKALSIFEMKDFTIVFKQEEFEGVVVPSSLVLTYKYRVFWGDTYEKLEHTYENRQKLTRP